LSEREVFTHLIILIYGGLRLSKEFGFLSLIKYLKNRI
jgi:hypothetical protein